MTRVAPMPTLCLVPQLEKTLSKPGNCPPVGVADVVTALSHALDLSTGRPEGHSVRTYLLGMRIGQEIGLTPYHQHNLYYALLLKDGGCSSNASKLAYILSSDRLQAKQDVRRIDWTHRSLQSFQRALAGIAPARPFRERVDTLLQMRTNQKKRARAVTRVGSESGAEMARLMGLSERTAEAIASLDEHWDGQGNPEGLDGTEIPLLSRIMLLAQTLEVCFATCGSDAALEVVKERSRRWFDPDLVKAAFSLNRRGALWTDVMSDEVSSLVLRQEPFRMMLREGHTTLDSICKAFAQIVDAKSPFTSTHSNGVANAAVAIARTFGLNSDRVLFLRHAALLHDIGQLAVPNSILIKPGKPSEAEWNILRRHPFHTWNILRRIPGFEDLAEVAASHHEKLDGSGYCRGLAAPQLTLEARILAVADTFAALSAKRPYRDAMPLEMAFETLRQQTPHALDESCIYALEQSGFALDQTYVDLMALQEQLNKAI